MAEYAALQAERFVSATTSTISGIPVDVDDEREVFGRSLVPIIPCFCVHDAPEHPCTCGGPTIWIFEDDIFEESGSDRRSADGEKIVDYRVRPEARVIAEATVPLRASGVVDRLEGSGVVTEGDGDLEWLFQEKEDLPDVKLPGLAGKLWDAFEVGWEIGQWLDDEFDLSDKISDWLHDWFGDDD